MESRNESGTTANRVQGPDERVCLGHNPVIRQAAKGRDEIRVLGKQLLRAGTSVAAHVREASRARSNEEFVSKLGGALQEADESQLWLELLREDCGIAPTDTLRLEKESGELIAVMTTMVNRTKGKS